MNENIINRIDLKSISIPTDSGCAILTYNVYVPKDFGTLEDIHKKARDSLLKRVTEEIKEEMIKKNEELLQ